MTSEESERSIGPEDEAVIDLLLIERLAAFAALLFPLMFWLQGPPVSPDQYFFRTLFWCIAIFIAVTLGGRRYYLSRRLGENG